MTKWFEEVLYADYYCQKIKKDEVLVSRQTPFQALEIFSNSFLGKVLTLDGVVQTSERDEYFYHEMFVHVPFNSFAAYTGNHPSKVLIIGGGDGGILREALQHCSINEAVMVEIDEAVTRECVAHMPSISNGAFNDPRVRVNFADGIEYVINSAKNGYRYDIILVDSTDRANSSESLFTEEFYQACRNCLSRNGILCTQSGVPFFQASEMIDIKQKLGKVFPMVSFFVVPVPLYVGGFMVLSFASSFSPNQLSQNSIAEAFKVASIMGSKYYNPDVHFGSFLLPNYIKKALQ